MKLKLNQISQKGFPIKKIKYNESHINTNHYYINDSAFEMLKNIKGSCGDFQCGKRHGLILDIAYQYSRRGVGILGDSSATMTRYYLVLHYALRKDEDNSHILHSGSITDVNSFRSSESIYGYIKASEDIQNILAISAFRKLQMHIVSLCKESRFS